MGNSASKQSDVLIEVQQVPTNKNNDEAKNNQEINKPEGKEKAAEQVSKCPMKMEGGFLSPWMKKHHPPLAKSENNDSQKNIPMEEEVEEAVSKCPIKQESQSSFFGLWNSNSSPPKEEKVQYNVYSQPITINKSNMIPSDVNQLPNPRQKEELSTDRVKSSIPKGGSDDDSVTWTYPSPQMFYNSLARKNKLNDTPENEISMIVHIHNHMNEKTWKTVLQWESLVSGESTSTPKLLKFQGRPMDLSPKAAFKHYILGHPLPFDRHDWYVETSNDNDNSTELKRYVIDYYYQEESKDDENILIDVRPALDSLPSFINRCYTMPLARYNNATSFLPLPLKPTKELKNEFNDSIQVWENNIKSKLPPSTKTVNIQDDNENSLSEEEAMALVKSFMEAVKECQPTENDEMKQVIGTNVCMAKFLCPLQHSTLVKVLHDAPESEKEDANKMDSIIENMTLCVHEKSDDVRDILNNGFDSQEEQERLFEKYGIDTDIKK